MTKTVKINQPFFGEKEFTLKEFQRRWLGSANEIWAFLLDHGNREESDFGQKLVEDIMPKVTEKAFNKFYEKVVRHNQGRKGSREILNAYNEGKSIQVTSKAPWNRTKKMLHNMADEDLKALADDYNIDINLSRESLIRSMIRTGADPSNKAIRNDPKVVKMYIDRQKKKVSDSSIEVDKILKEM